LPETKRSRLTSSSGHAPRMADLGLGRGTSRMPSNRAAATHAEDRAWAMRVSWHAAMSNSSCNVMAVT